MEGGGEEKSGGGCYVGVCYLVERRETVDVAGVDVGAFAQQPHDLLLVSGGARREEHAIR